MVKHMSLNFTLPYIIYITPSIFYEYISALLPRRIEAQVLFHKYLILYSYLTVNIHSLH